MNPVEMLALVAFVLLLLAIWTVAAFGAAYVLGHSRITRGIRAAVAGPDLVKCDRCGVVERVDFSTDVQAGSVHHSCPGYYFSIIRPRQWPVLLVECPACLGAWLGVIGGLVIAPYVPDLSNYTVIGLLVFYTAGSNLMLGKKFGLMD